MEFAFCRWQIPKEMFWKHQLGKRMKDVQKKEKREQAPALHTQLSTGLIVSYFKGKSMGKTFPC